LLTSSGFSLIQERGWATEKDLDAFKNAAEFHRHWDQPTPQMNLQEALGYTFRPRLAMNRWGKTFVNFSPGMSNRAAKAIRQTMRDWKLDCRIDKRIDDLAKIFNPIIRGWVMYYGRYHKSALSRALMHLDLRLARWWRHCCGACRCGWRWWRVTGRASGSVRVSGYSTLHVSCYMNRWILNAMMNADAAPELIARLASGNEPFYWGA
jgi:hypothetical protein